MWKIRQSGYRVLFSGWLRVSKFDHRWLDPGMARKSIHSILRCFLLFSGILARHVRRSDWGY